ncbi:hypothetical protein RFI_06461, partial [Reticulomyxa filosa]
MMEYRRQLENKTKFEEMIELSQQPWPEDSDTLMILGLLFDYLVTKYGDVLHGILPQFMAIEIMVSSQLQQHVLESIWNETKEQSLLYSTSDDTNGMIHVGESKTKVKRTPKQKQQQQQQQKKKDKKTTTKENETWQNDDDDTLIGLENTPFQNGWNLREFVICLQLIALAQDHLPCTCVHLYEYVKSKCDYVHLPNVLIESDFIDYYNRGAQLPIFDCMQRMTRSSRPCCERFHTKQIKKKTKKQSHVDTLHPDLHCICDNSSIISVGHDHGDNNEGNNENRSENDN